MSVLHLLPGFEDTTLLQRSLDRALARLPRNRQAHFVTDASLAAAEIYIQPPRDRVCV